MSWRDKNIFCQNLNHVKLHLKLQSWWLNVEVLLDFISGFESVGRQNEESNETAPSFFEILKLHAGAAAIDWIDRQIDRQIEHAAFFWHDIKSKWTCWHHLSLIPEETQQCEKSSFPSPPLFQVAFTAISRFYILERRRWSLFFIENKSEKCPEFMLHFSVLVQPFVIVQWMNLNQTNLLVIWFKSFHVVLKQPLKIFRLFCWSAY